MALPILNEVHEEITRLYIAGSALAAGDPRVKKYIHALQKLGEKAPVFKTLAERLETLVDGDNKDSPEALLEAGVLLYSLRYTQGTTETGKETRDMVYGEKPLGTSKIPYSRLNPLISRLTSGSIEQPDELREVFEAGQHRYPRLFAAYCTAVVEKKTPISTYVAETIIPNIGADMIPFVEEALDVKGGIGQARLLMVLYGLKGKDMLPLAEKALAEGSEHTMEAAIRIFGEDPKYEETLLAYTEDRKAGPKGAAFAALAQMGSEKGERAILEALSKARIGYLEEALQITRNPGVFQKVLDEAAALLPAYKDHGPKLKVLLQTLAARDEEAGLAFLEKTLMNNNFRSEAWNVLDVNVVIMLLMDADTRRKTEMVYRIAEKDESLIGQKLQTAVKLFSAEEVYEKCHKDIGKKNYWTLTNVYQISWGRYTPDREKTWDRRWGKHFIGGAQYMELAATVIYNDDDETWTKLLDEMVNSLKKKKGSPYYSSNFAQILARAFINKHPKAQAYYDRFIAAGFPKEDLAFIFEGSSGEVQG